MKKRIANPDAPFQRPADVARLTGLPISHIRAAISSATGEEDHILASPTADVTSQPGELLVMGEITWQ